LKIFLPFRRAFSAISLRARICCTVLLSFQNPACSSAMCSFICMLNENQFKFMRYYQFSMILRVGHMCVNQAKNI